MPFAGAGGWPPDLGGDPEPPGPWRSGSPAEALRNTVAYFSSAPQHLSCWARASQGGLGSALVFRVRAGRALHVAGGSPLAAELRSLLTAGAEPGWVLHPVPAGRTPLHLLAEPLGRQQGGARFFNLLDRAGFAFAEEVAATPDECLLDLRGGGPKFLAAVREAAAALAAGTGGGGTTPPGPGAGPWPADGADVLEAVRVVAAWAAAVEGAVTAGDLIPPVPRGASGDLPADVAAAWQRIRETGLRSLAGDLLPDAGPGALARDLIAQVDERRQLIVTARTFAAPPQRRTYDELAADLGVTRERVRQLEADALVKLSRAAAGSRFALLRWLAAAPHAAAGDGEPAWMAGLLQWLREGGA